MNNLLGINIQQEDLNKYLQKQGVLVDLHVYRKRNNKTLSTQSFGIDKNKSEELKNFFDEHIKEGVIQFLPNSVEKELVKLENKLRIRKKRTAMGYGNSFMTIKQFKDFKVKFLEARDDYYEQRDYIVNNYNMYISNFVKELEMSLDKMEAINKDELKKSIIDSIPTMEDYRDSYSMELEVRAFPILANVDLFDEEIANEIKESVSNIGERSVKEIVANSISDVFNVLSICYNGYVEKGCFKKRNKGTIKDLEERLNDKNIFKNDFISIVQKKLKNLIDIEDDDEMGEEIEIILSNLYGYSFDNQITDFLDIDKKSLVIDEEQMMDIYILEKIF